MSSIAKVAPATFSIPMDDLKCPITRDWFIDPVIDPDGHIFERDALQKWAGPTGECACPIGREPLKVTQLYPVLTVKTQAAAARHAEENPNESPKPTIEETVEKIAQTQDKMLIKMHEMAIQMVPCWLFDGSSDGYLMAARWFL